MESTSVRRRLAAAVLAATTILTVLVVAPGARAQVPAGELRFGENYRLGADPAPTRGRDVPGLAVNPADPNHIVSIDVDYLNGECAFKTSFDGGLTWPNSGVFEAPPTGFNPPFPDPPCFQNFDSGGYAHGNASVIFGAGQRVYTAFSSHRGPFQRPESGIISGAGDDVLVARSDDGGRTFRTAVVAIQGGPDPQPFFIRPQLAVHRGAAPGGNDRIYINAWRCRVISGGCSGGDDVRQMWSNRSDDNGQTWAAPVQVSGPSAVLPQGQQTNEPSQPVVDPRNGNVYMSYHRRDNAVTSPATPAVNHLEFARSTDLGQTWTRIIAGPTAANTNAHPRLAIDSNNGNLYIAYQNVGFGTDADIAFVRSTNGGLNWSAPIRVNDDPVNNGFSQGAPRVEVAPNGRVDVIWIDRRHSSTLSTLGDIYYAYSTNAGQTFSPNRRITDRHLNTNVGLTGVGGYTWYGAVMAARGNDSLLVAWTDSREGNFNNGGQDIYLSNLDLRSPTVNTKRVGATTQTGLAVAMSRLAYPGGLESAGGLAASKPVIVNEADPVMALIGAPLARANLAPLLPSPAARLTADTKAEVARMEAPAAYVIGDEGALGAGVVTALTEAAVPEDKIVRLAGSTPADTAKRVAVEMDPRTPVQRAANTTRAFEAVIVVNPAAPESMGAVGLATSLRVPILFTDQNSVPAQTREAIALLNTNATLIVGGAGAVSDAVAASLPGPKRVAAGADISSVALQAAQEAKVRLVPTNIAYVADSNQPFDAALIATASGRNGGFLLMVPGADPALADQQVAQIGSRATLDRIVSARSSGPAAGSGYRLVARDGGIFAFGGAGFFGSTGGMRLAQPMVGMANTPSNRGYWTVAGDGGVFSFGDAQFRGSTGAIRLAQPMVGMAPTPSGNGYWLVARDGGVFAFGDAKFFGSTGSIRLAQPIVAIASTPSGNGYWLVAADGGVFAFGDAQFRGSTGAIRLAQPMVGMAGSPSGNGYWLVARDGGIFAFGDARFFGSTGAIRLAQPVVSMDATSSGRGYWLTASDGGVFAFGDALFQGSTGGTRLNQPVVGMSAG